MAHALGCGRSLVKGNGREDSDLDLLVDAEPRFRDISVVEEIYLTGFITAQSGVSAWIS